MAYAPTRWKNFDVITIEPVPNDPTAGTTGITSCMEKDHEISYQNSEYDIGKLTNRINHIGNLYTASLLDVCT